MAKIISTKTKKIVNEYNNNNKINSVLFFIALTYVSVFNLLLSL